MIVNLVRKWHFLLKFKWVRKKVYKIVKQHYIDHPNGTIGICKRLNKLFNLWDKKNDISYEYVIYENFPELQLQKPEKDYSIDLFWFPLNDTDSRIKCLEEAIKLC